MTDLTDWPLTLVTRGSQETIRLGRILGETLASGDVVAITGEPGAGKTCLTQGIARGLGVPDSYEVTSPTFTRINEYPGRICLYHLDFYRLHDLGDLIDTGYEEYFHGTGVVVVEWADKAKDHLFGNKLRIQISYLFKNEREIKVSGMMKNGEQFLQALRRGGF